MSKIGKVYLSTRHQLFLSSLGLFGIPFWDASWGGLRDRMNNRGEDGGSPGDSGTLPESLFVYIFAREEGGFKWNLQRIKQCAFFLLFWLNTICLLCTTCAHGSFYAMACKSLAEITANGKFCFTLTLFTWLASTMYGSLRNQQKLDEIFIQTDHQFDA